MYQYLLSLCFLTVFVCSLNCDWFSISYSLMYLILLTINVHFEFTFRKRLFVCRVDVFWIWTCHMQVQMSYSHNLQNINNNTVWSKG